jgi:dUTP pyrophosphatase
MNIKMKRLTDTAILPTRGSDGAAGFDLYADSVQGEYTITNNKTVIVAGGSNVIVHTGIAMEIPKGYVGLLFARSGLSCKKGLRPANCVGVIDEDFRGEIIVNFHNDINFSTWYNAQNSDDTVKANDFVESFTEFDLHDRVAQMVFVKYEAFNPVEVDSLEDTARGKGGFGSTGSK